jgi:predicted DNA binding CopG/RHH family protein
VKEKAINFKIPEDFYKQIKIHVVMSGVTLKDYIVGLMRADLEISGSKEVNKNAS